MEGDRGEVKGEKKRWWRRLLRGMLATPVIK